jgi:protein-disulfide isomerase
MKKFLLNPITITLLIILAGVGGLVGAFQLFPGGPKENAPIPEHYWGNPEAKVVVTDYSDFQCPACQQFFTNVETPLKTEYKDRIKFVYKHFPLSIHASALKAAQAAEAAGEQGKFWEYHAKLFERQAQDANANNGDIWTNEELIGYARELGLDTQKFEESLKSEKFRKAVKDSQKEAEDRGFSGTPTILINNEPISNPTYETVKAKIDELLASQGTTTTPAPSATSVATTPTVVPTSVNNQ